MLKKLSALFTLMTVGLFFQSSQIHQVEASYEKEMPTLQKAASDMRLVPAQDGAKNDGVHARTGRVQPGDAQRLPVDGRAQGKDALAPHARDEFSISVPDSRTTNPEAHGGRVELVQADKPKVDWSKKPRGYKPMPAALKKAMHDNAFKRHGHLMRRLAKNTTAPAAFDAVAMGWVGPVVDQGNCGDCYGVSASDGTTGAFIKAGWGKNDGSFKISDQYGLDCGAYQGGCNGGDEAQVIDYMKNKGFPAEKWVDPTGKQMSDYGPYTAKAGTCNLAPTAKLWQLKDYGFVAGDQGQGPATLDEYKAALLTYGQLSIALDASSFNSYTSGVIANLGNSIDHAITMTGWDDAKQAVRCRNNWGTAWGENGYCWISYKALSQIVEPIWLLAPTLAPPPPIPPAPGALVITSPLSATGAVGGAFSYQIVATGATEFAAAGLPDNLTCAAGTGLITGTPSFGGSFNVTISAGNTSGITTATLVLTVAAPVPPTPAGPTITVSQTLQPGTYQVVPVNSIVIDPADSWDTIIGKVQAARAKKTVMAPVKTTEPPLAPVSLMKKLADLEDGQVEIMKWIKTQSKK